MMMNSHKIPIFGVYPGPIDTDMTKNINVEKESPKKLAERVFNSMEKGILDITTDKLSDHFISYLKKDPNAIVELKKYFSKLN